MHTQKICNYIYISRNEYKNVWQKGVLVLKVRQQRVPNRVTF